jgi:hypothetical protein
LLGKSPWGIWRAKDYDAVTNKVIEARRNGRDVLTSGKIEFVTEVGHGSVIPVSSMNGGISSTLLWPFINSPNFTICSLSRYTGKFNRGRILGGTFQTEQCDFFHGHFGGKFGVAYYGGWTAQSRYGIEGSATDWLVMCGQNGDDVLSPDNVLANGKPVGTQKSGSYRPYCRFGVNYVSVGTLEPSEWAIADVIVWDRHLTLNDMKSVSSAMLKSLIPCPSNTFWNIDTGACWECPDEFNFFEKKPSMLPTVFPTMPTAIPTPLPTAPTVTPSASPTLSDTFLPIEYLIVGGGGGGTNSGDGAGGGGGGVLSNVGGNAHMLSYGVRTSVVVGIASYNEFLCSSLCVYLIVNVPCDCVFECASPNSEMVTT